MNNFLSLQLLTLLASSSCRKLEKDPETACDFRNFITVTNSLGETVDGLNCGVIKVNKNDWQTEPFATFFNAKEDRTYTILLIDPDVPGYPKGQYFLHWLKINIPGLEFRLGGTSRGNPLEPYIGPAPPDPKFHRYMFIVFEERTFNQNIQPPTPNKRENFEFLKWVKSQNLCRPVAGVEFLSEV